MDKTMKSLVYRFGIDILKLYWRLKGSRHITAFGDQYRVTRETVFPNHRHLRLPRGGCLSEIVRYTDFVQMHSLCRYAEELRDQPVIVDVGAFHGVYTVILGRIIKKREGRVIAVEPNPEAYKILTRNVNLNNLDTTCICEQVGLLDKPGRCGFKIFGSESYITHDRPDTHIEVTSLEKILEKYGIEKVDLLIIDVEGAELLVLRGFPWYKLRPGKVFCELHPYAWKEFGYSGEDLSNFLRQNQYRCFDMYLYEHSSFKDESYIGPTVFVSAQGE